MPTPELLDERAVSEIEALNWKKGFPDLDGDYYCRVDEYDKQPTLIRIESRSSSASAAVYEFGCGDNLRREYEAEEEYEYLGPLNPESIPALCATVKHLRAENEELKEEMFEQQPINQSGVDFRTRAIQLCKDKAAGYEALADRANNEPAKVRALAYANSASEISAALEKL